MPWVKVKGLKVCLLVESALSLYSKFTGTLDSTQVIIRNKINIQTDPSWLCANFFVWPLVFKLGQPRTNPASGQNRTQTQGCRIMSLMCLPLSHTAGQVSLVLLSCSALIAHIILALLSPFLCLDTLYSGMSLRSSRDQGFPLATISMTG